ncbi:MULTISPECIES: LysR substrate-binding domain-containing protein [Shewanella]|jgi:DNA-binding transcriptional LysR family regulator|uniref:LysR substrate-binding domain-containing protein n=1 Tax=Shewanella TaxID=22 RepID=UPI00157079A3|nr:MULTISPECIES: LysR substrate-binding domain-containing protein [unclassified Shewanella]MBP8117827.1 LysR family transcriptional regulator [Shewanella sp.]MBS0044406.1 LysR family transcriptional regulator [Shewanella sp. M16]MCU7976257.1 LysR substrate-binding domain-containing protein [Shewanella sp. SW36]MCU7986802.1 LysR substrate-binding domain-containing protein [Shewanella sp. SW24]MCU7991497.1 LysR substrate-binding domain-containing protein [Shewanella sp. SW1]
MRKLPPLRALQVFEAAARQQHFSKAADELCITQSAVSHQVRVLEEYFGEQLFDRQGRKLQLTPKGHGLFLELERIFNELSDLNLKVRDTPNQQLCLAVYSSFSVKWLIPRLADFRRQYPSVKIRLEMITQDPDLSTSTADIFIAGKLNQRGYWQQLLHKERLIPVCSPSFYLKWRDISLSNFQQQALLVVDEGPLGLDWHKWSSAHQIPLDNEQQHVFSHIVMAIEAAIAGQGLALAPDFMVAGDITTGRLVALNLPDVHTGFEFTFFCKQRRLSEPAIAAFSSWLKSQA